MRLLDILSGIDYIGEVSDETDISFVTSDSRKADKDCIFVAIKGLKFDGHDHIVGAVAKKAAYIVCEKDVGLSNQIVVKNSRAAYALMCANFYGNPSKSLKLIAVTGTNGKTTVTRIIKQILELSGRKTGLIGTIENEIGDLVLPAKHTTPDPSELHVLFGRMVKSGCEYAVMETSSHALDQHRLDGCEFSAAVFTNLSQDHLDYHGDMENYYQAKKKIFDKCENAIINSDDDYGKRLIGELKAERDVSVITFSSDDDSADYTARNIEKHPEGVDFAFVGSGIIQRMKFGMPGGFSVSNAMAAASTCVCLGLSLEEIAYGLDNCKGVKGRAEVIPTGLGFTVICDYAHSPDGLEKIITAMKDLAKGRVVTLFGCAGNRDAAKRPIMGKIVGSLSDFVVLTSDNPRSEDPQTIIDQTLEGVIETGTPYKVFPDRYQAIKWALENSQKNDILILAGKGHEDYQVLAHGTIAFDEHKIVNELLERLRAGEN